MMKIATTSLPAVGAPLLGGFYAGRYQRLLTTENPVQKVYPLSTVSGRMGISSTSENALIGTESVPTRHVHLVQFLDSFIYYQGQRPFLVLLLSLVSTL